MKNKKEKCKDTEPNVVVPKGVLKIATKSDLKEFLSGVRDKLLKEEAPPIFAMVAMKQVLNHDDVYGLLDNQTKEILQEIWVKLSQSGFHLRKPPLIFTEVDLAAANK